MFLTMLPLFGDTHAIGIVLDEGNKMKLDFLNEVLFVPRPSGKVTYTMWIRYFKIGKGKNSGHHVQAMVAYWLSWFVLPTGPKHELNSFVFPLAIYWKKGRG